MKVLAVCPILFSSSYPPFCETVGVGKIPGCAIPDAALPARVLNLFLTLIHFSFSFFEKWSSSSALSSISPNLRFRLTRPSSPSSFLTSSCHSRIASSICLRNSVIFLTARAVSSLATFFPDRSFGVEDVVAVDATVILSSNAFEDVQA